MDSPVRKSFSTIDSDCVVALCSFAASHACSFALSGQYSSNSNFYACPAGTYSTSALADLSSCLPCAVDNNLQGTPAKATSLTQFKSGTSGARWTNEAGGMGATSCFCKPGYIRQASQFQSASSKDLAGELCQVQKCELGELNHRKSYCSWFSYNY